MKKVLFASLLAVASAALFTSSGFAQLGAQGGQVQMSAEEYKAYNDAATAATPAAKATAFKAYLVAYPNSAVKNDVLNQIMFDYVQANDAPDALTAADAVLASDPNNLPAYIFETQLRTQSGDLAGASDFAKKGIALGQPKGMTADVFANLKTNGYPVMYSAIGAQALASKDSAGAVAAYKSELMAVPVAQTEATGLELQDTYSLARAYLVAAPPDLLDCAYYAGRGMNYAPEPYKTTFGQLAKYCYDKYHGADDGYDDMVAVAKDNLTPPPTFSVKPAPKPQDIVANLIATTPDLATLALSDKEYVLQNGKPADADKVFDTVKGKTVEIPDAVVVAATATQLQVAVSDDSKQAQPTASADFTFTMKDPLKTVPAVGDKVTLDGTYASYTQSPLMISMSDGVLVPAKKAPVKRTPPARRPH